MEVIDKNGQVHNNKRIQAKCSRTTMYSQDRKGVRYLDLGIIKM